MSKIPVHSAIFVGALAAAVSAAGSAAPSDNPGASCEATSGLSTGALVELFTSEGCSSCPPADRLLMGLTQSTALVPLALHVGYWDDLGWRDPYANPDFARRQDWLAAFGARGVVYTPQIFVGGREARPEALAGRIAAIGAEPAQADIRLRVHPEGPDAVAIEARAQSHAEDAALYLAVAENGLSSPIEAGENAGRRLEHGHVVRVWMGPSRLIEGMVALRRSVPIAKGWRRERLEASAFVQDQRTGRVLQAVGTGPCVLTGGPET